MVFVKIQRNREFHEKWANTWPIGTCTYLNAQQFLKLKRTSFLYDLFQMQVGLGYNFMLNLNEHGIYRAPAFDILTDTVLA